MNKSMTQQQADEKLAEEYALKKWPQKEFVYKDMTYDEMRDGACEDFRHGLQHSRSQVEELVKALREIASNQYLFTQMTGEKAAEIATIVLKKYEEYK